MTVTGLAYFTLTVQITDAQVLLNGSEKNRCSVCSHTVEMHTFLVSTMVSKSILQSIPISLKLLL